MTQSSFNFLTCIILLSLFTSCTTPRGAVDRQPLSASVITTLIAQLQKRNFVCAKEAGSPTTKCKGRFSDYPDDILLFIPNDLVVVDVSLSYHFHGHNILNTGVSDSQREKLHFGKMTGDFGKWIYQADYNGIIIAPLSKGLCSTYNTYFQISANTNKFFEDIDKEFAEMLGLVVEAPIRKSISSHSGADETIEFISKLLHSEQASSVKAIGLFDSMYEKRTEIVRFSMENKIPIFDSFIERGSTYSYQIWLAAQFKNSPELFLTSTDKDPWHANIMERGHYVKFLKFVKLKP